MNRYDSRQIYAATLHACLFAVREGFPHLTARDILDPPHRWFDAAMARQVVMHLMIVEFRYPKRRVVEMEDRSREAINRALRTIDARLETPRFANHYRAMAIRARALFSIRMEDAA